VASEANESLGERGDGWFVMEPLNILLSICSNESLASARANVLSRNGYSVITVQTIDDGVSFCAMLDMQVVIIDQIFCPHADHPTLAGFTGIPVLQLHHSIHSEELVAWVHNHARVPVAGYAKFIDQS